MVLWCQKDNRFNFFLFFTKNNNHSIIFLHTHLHVASLESNRYVFILVIFFKGLRASRSFHAIFSRATIEQRLAPTQQIEYYVRLRKLQAKIKGLCRHWMELYRPYVTPGQNPSIRILLLLHRSPKETYSPRHRRRCLATTGQNV